MAKPILKVADFSCRQSLGYLNRRLFNLLMPRAEALFADAELTFSQWVALMSLRDGIVSTAADIARHLDHDTGATTRMIDQMEKRGLVTRTRSTEDRRIVNLSLTPQGRAVARSLVPRIVDFWNEALDGFTPAEVEALTELMRRLGDRLETMPIADEPRRRA
ncbi:MAG TPA: MarR family transcriptional regulator [Rhizomicrobium sp.]|jgi:DNA-binding MarR family transcriptional regulator